MRPVPLILCVVLASCSANSGVTGEPSTPEDTGALGTVPEELRLTIVRDAAARAGVSPDEVRVVKAQRTTWNDGSLGCPKPGEFYTQALVAGWWIVVQAGGTSYDFRAGDGGGYKLCEPGASPGGAGTY